MITNGSRTVYIDPWKVRKGLPKADLILVTHGHSDHYSPEDITMLSGSDTLVLAPEAMPQVTDVIPVGRSFSYEGITVKAVPAYNISKQFHPKAKGWVGYIVGIDGRTIYHAGDTDHIPEMDDLDVDAALIPVGGTYTMDEEEAAGAARAMRARALIPIHFGDIVGSKENAERFSRIAGTETHILDPGQSYVLS
jgi:L-ascorbate metabolism protein UlaG (beta-lactamase superfamily)